MALKIYFRTDASLKIGTGHVMRCLTLAEALREIGKEVEFVCRDHSGNLIDLISRKNFVVNELSLLPTYESQTSDYKNKYATWLGVSEIQDAEQTINVFGAKQPDWLIVDHYALGKYWQSKIRPHVGKIMVIDDLADRAHDCDLLLNQNYFIGGESRYNNLLSKTCTKMLGPQYALLRPEFAEVRKHLKPRTGTVHRVFVFFGGVDSHNVTSMALRALSVSDCDDLQVDVVIGENNQHRSQITDLVAKRARTKLHVQVENIAELMVQADLALGAGGINTWERMCLDLFSMVITTANNQIPTIKHLNAHKYVKFLGDHKKVNESSLGANINEYVNNMSEIKRNKMLIDGLGTNRVSKALSNSTER